MKKIKIIIEICLTITILLLNFLSYFFEKYRILVFVLGILYCLFFFGQLIFSFIQLIRKEIPFGLITTITVIIFFQNDSVNSNYRVVENRSGVLINIIASMILAIILTSILFLHSEEKRIKDFLAFSIVSILLSTGIVMYGIFPIVNYSFDMTETEIVEVTVSNYVGEDSSLKGAYFDTHYIYDIETTNNTTISQISIDSDYKIKANTHVLIKYRKGIFCEIYKIDYSTLTSIED